MWYAQETLAINLGHLLDVGDGAVVTVTIGDTGLVMHRTVLAARSPVSATVFQRVTLESSSAQVTVSALEDPVLRQLLAFLCRLQARPPQLPSTASQLLPALSNKCGVPSLEDRCEQQVSAGTAGQAVHMAVLAARSPVSAAVLQRITLESSSGQGTVSAVEDPVLRQLLAFLCRLQTRPPQLPATASRRLPALADKCGDPALEDRCEQQVYVGTAAALAVGHSCSGVGQGAVAYVEPHSVEVMATRGWVGATNTLAEDVGEISGRLSETGTLGPAVSGSSPYTTTQPRRVRRRRYRTRASTAPTTAASDHTPPPDDTIVSRLRSLSAEEKGRRLIEAAKEGAVEDLETLLVAGADAGFRDADWFRRTALHWAAAEGHAEAARRLVWCGAAADTRSSTWWTPLHLAAQGGHAAVVRLLLAAPADHSARDCQGWTPLHVAAFGGHTEVATTLMEAGADKGNTDVWGNTPQDVATQRGHWQLVDLLAVPPSLDQYSL